MPGASNDGGEDGPGGVITGEAGLAHAGAIVDDKSGNVLVTHLGRSLNLVYGEEDVEGSIRTDDAAEALALFYVRTFGLCELACGRGRARAVSAPGS